LQDDEKKLFLLSCQPGSGMIRISSEYEKRVFLVERQGFLKSRTVLRNEYGVKIAQVFHETTDAGMIEFDASRFSYKIQKHLLKELLIYDENGEMLINCELPSVVNKIYSDYHHLILALTWYSFISAENKLPQYA
jgi:hypothetical protein